MPHSDWIIRNCPSCGTSEMPKLEISSKNPAEDLSFQEVRDFFVGLRKDQVFFSYFRCLGCHLLFCRYYFSDVQLAALYADMPDNLMGEDKSTASKTQGGYVRWMSRKLVTVKSFLELGPDIGLVSHEIVNRFHPESATLIEPNVSIHPRLMESVRHVKQVTLVNDLSELSVSSHDLLVGIHVIDHLLNPREDLLLLSKLATRTSKLSFVVHNEKSFLRTLMNDKWPPLCLQHPQLFNPASISRLLQASGWQLEDHARSTNWWHLRNLVGTALNIFGLNSRASRFLPNTQVPTKLGNFIGLASLQTEN